MPDPCGWPDCNEPAIDALPMLPGMQLRVRGVAFDRDAFPVCPAHAPRLGEILEQAIASGQRQSSAKPNLAPGDVEWESYFGDDEEERGPTWRTDPGR